MGTEPVVAAFTEDQVARLTGLTKRQLSYWDRTGFFRPAFGAESRRVAFSRVYSFRDVVSLRVLSALLNCGVSLQHLRQVSEKLNYLRDDRWTKQTLYVLKRKVLFSDPETGLPREIVSGQYAMGIAISAVINDTRQDVATLIERPRDKVGAITRSRRVANNAAVIAGTRIRTVAIKRFHEAGYTFEQIMQEYPGLTEQDIKAALAHEEQRSAA